jgi:uncharacterized membrane protein
MGFHEKASYAATVAGAALALATLVPVALYQTSVISRLPDPPSPFFDSEWITASKDAYPLGVPDALLGLGSYSATLALALAAPKSGVARKLLAVKLAADGSMAAFNVVKQVVKFRRLCSWCTGTAVATGIMVVAGHRYLKQSAS